MPTESFLRPLSRLPGSVDAIGSIDEVRSLVSIVKPRPEEAPESFARGEMLIARGWIANPHAIDRPHSVAITVDDTYDVEAHGRIYRADVAAAFDDRRFAFVGFAAIVSTAHLAPGEHTLAVFVHTDDPPARHALPQTRTFTLADASVLLPDLPRCESDRVTGCVDEIRVEPLAGFGDDDGGAASVFVRGWACDVELREPVADVFGAFADSTARAVFGFPRLDVAAALGDRAYERCGFHLRLFTTDAFAVEGLRVDALTADRRALSALVGGAA